MSRQGLFNRIALARFHQDSQLPGFPSMSLCQPWISLKRRAKVATGRLTMLILEGIFNRLFQGRCTAFSQARGKDFFA